LLPDIRAELAAARRRVIWPLHLGVGRVIPTT
jgi:hypothetical protein